MELYLTVGDWSLGSALTKYSVKEYWLRAALCSLAMGVSRISAWPGPGCHFLHSRSRSTGRCLLLRSLFFPFRLRSLSTLSFPSLPSRIRIRVRVRVRPAHTQDLVTTQRLLDEFARKDVTFPSTREAKFAYELMQACEEADVERYTAAVYGYDQVTKLDNWKTSVLLKVKKALEEDEGGLT
jgi:hypothetical protein